MVHFVGAGPGACDLITVRGMNRIREADVIIYAGSLVNPELLSYAKADCKIYNSAHMTLEDVVSVMREAEAAGKGTVRLHTGDPSVYGAIREQMDLLDECGIAYDVCPGVSAVFGAAASLACEYTLPDVTQTLILTRAEGKTPVPEKENLRSLAAHRASLVLYLSSGLARKVRQDLLFGGYAEDTPVAVVYKATWPEEKIIRTTLAKLPEDMEAAGITKTALIIVSPALGSVYEKSRLYDAAFATEYRGATEIAFPAGIRRVLLITCSVRGYATMQKLAKKLENISGAEIITKVKCEALPEVSMKGTVKACVDAYFEQVDAIVFVTASGIAVRSVAEHLAHKSEDPAIVCMDECGKHVISLVSGHAGGANALTQMLADVMWATPVITTATDVEGRFSIDEYAREHNLVVTDWAKAKAISAEVLAAGAEPVWVDEAAGSQEEEKNECEIGKEQKSTGIDVGKIENDGCKNEVDGCGNRVGGCENRIDGCGNRVDGCGNRINVKRLQIGSHQVIITPQDGSVDVQTLQLIPRCIVAGVGCKKGTPVDKIEHAVQDAFAKAGLQMEALCAVVSIDLKKEEAGLLEFCETRNVPFETYAAEELQAVPGTYSASEFVSGVTGVDNVCERSAVKYASEHGMKQDQPLPGRQAKHGELLIRKQAQDGELLLRKQAYGGVTVALAYVCSE
ncbi:MAG: precorrin-4 C(11)-methyltransferase [Wujia sp.]|nr:precorrin-4 C(11)-methyltransferase [Wujia sp.]MDY3726647.1 precorrin-4 C(11)-methyltransferase [Wujia sp.]